MALLLFIYPAMALTVEDASTTALMLLALFGVIFSFRDERQVSLSHDEKLLFFAVGFFMLIAVATWMLGDSSYIGFKKLGRYLRFLLLIPIYLVVRRMPGAEGVWWWGLNIGALLSGGFAIAVFVFGFDYGLVAGHLAGAVDPFQFGALSALLAMMSLASLLYFRQLAAPLGWLPILSAVAGLTGSIASGMIGTWIGLPALLAILFWFSWRRAIKLPFILFLAASVVLLVTNDFLQVLPWDSRLDSFLIDLKTAGEGFQGSVNIRFHLWGMAWQAFLENPVFGGGVGSFFEVLRAHVESGQVPERYLLYSHPLNEYLTALAERGLAGFLALGLVFGVPLKHFIWGVRHPDEKISSISLAGVLLIAGFMQLGLIETVFDRTQPITFYVFSLAVIYGLVRANERRFLAKPHKRNRSLGVFIIAMNEADRIGKTLDAVHGWADEIVVLDSGSTDGTVDVVHKYTDKVWVTDWPGFGAQKQRALEKASTEWVLSVDADEIVTPELRAEIDYLLSKEPKHTGFDVHRPVVLFGRVMDFSGSGQSPLRLFKRTEGEFTQVPVHEKVVLKSGSMARTRGSLYHETYRDYHHAVFKFAEYSSLQSDARYEKGKRSGVFVAAVRGFLNFVHNYFVRLGMLDGRRGFILAALHANYTFNKYAALWVRNIQERQQDKTSRRDQ